MPRGDKTGPMSEGSMTGRKMGFCTGNSDAGYFNDTDKIGLGRQNRGWRFGIGNGGKLGRGSGFGRRFSENTNTTNPVENENHNLRNEISELRNRLSDLEKKS